MHLTGTRQTLDLLPENAFLLAAACPLHLRSLEEVMYGVHSAQSKEDPPPSKDSSPQIATVCSPAKC